MNGKRSSKRRKRMGLFLLISITAVACAASEAHEAETAADAVFPRTGQQDLQTTDDSWVDLVAFEQALESIEEQLQRIELRLGPTMRRPTLTTSIERRLEDIERRLTRIEQQLGQMRNMDQRIRRLETQRE